MIILIAGASHTGKTLLLMCELNDGRQSWEEEYAPSEEVNSYFRGKNHY